VHLHTETWAALVREVRICLVGRVGAGTGKVEGRCGKEILVSGCWGAAEGGGAWVI